MNIKEAFDQLFKILKDPESNIIEVELFVINNKGKINKVIEKENENITGKNVL